MTLKNRLAQLEKTHGNMPVKFLIVTTHDDKNYYAKEGGYCIDIDSLDNANLPEGVTHYTDAELENLPEGVKVVVISYASDNK